MSAEKIYKCNLCKDKIIPSKESFGLFFKNMSEFTLDAHNRTDGTHICFKCARQLDDQFLSDEIKDILYNKTPADDRCV
jgi:hypothetical protein